MRGGADPVRFERACRCRSGPLVVSAAAAARRVQSSLHVRRPVAGRRPRATASRRAGGGGGGGKGVLRVFQIQNRGACSGSRAGQRFALLARAKSPRPWWHSVAVLLS